MALSMTPNYQHTLNRRSTLLSSQKTSRWTTTVLFHPRLAKREFIQTKCTSRPKWLQKRLRPSRRCLTSTSIENQDTRDHNKTTWMKDRQRDWRRQMNLETRRFKELKNRKVDRKLDTLTTSSRNFATLKRRSGWTTLERTKTPVLEI